MPKKKVLTHVARIRIPGRLYLKILIYARKHGCHESDVIREALKKFLHNVSTKEYTIEQLKSKACNTRE